MSDAHSATDQLAKFGLTLVEVAELDELRALKAKVDEPDMRFGQLDPPYVIGWNDCLAWLRETTDD